MIGLLTDDEERDAMVGIDLEEGVDVWCNVFEDEHDVVSVVQVIFFILLDL